MSTRLFTAAAFSLLLLSAAAPAAEMRSWTTPRGAVTAEYMGSTADSVTLRAANGQAFRLRTTELSEADRTYVAQQQEAARQANMIEAKFKGEIIWRLPSWNSLSWSTDQAAEICLWDEKQRKPGDKLIDVKVSYTRNGSNRNQFEGSFTAGSSVRLPKDAKVVIRAKFKATVDGKQKEMDETSVIMHLPALVNGEMKLPAVRLSLTH